MFWDCGLSKMIPRTKLCTDANEITTSPVESLRARLPIHLSGEDIRVEFLEDGRRLLRLFVVEP